MQVHGHNQKQNITSSDGRNNLNDRDHSIDTFRGLAIIGMIFFSILLKFGEGLPEVLRHNVRGAFHIGDVVLPMFLFASGMSLAYFFAKTKGKKEEEFYHKIFKRVGILALVAFGLSYFSAGGFLRMDEIMLSLILFLGCVVLFRVRWYVNLILIAVIYTTFPVIGFFGWDGTFANYYLGGYLAALYYFPIMLTGLLLGQGLQKERFFNSQNLIIMIVISLMFMVSLIFYPVNKLGATPSFMLLSTTVCILLFILISQITSKVGRLRPLEFIGKKPLKYWILMYVLILIPWQLNYQINGEIFQVHWVLASVGAVGFLVLLAGAFHGFSVMKEKHIANPKTA